MSPNQKQRLKPLLKKLVMEVRQELNEDLNPATQRQIQKNLWAILVKIRGNVDPSVYSRGEEFLRSLNYEFGSTVPK